jgi:hypothetical protein
MTISLNKARSFVYAHGALWERALFSYLFDGGSLEHVHQCLMCYKNPDGGWAHGLEHDLTCPDSNPIALEYLLTVFRDTGIPPGAVLDGTLAWVEANRNSDGTFKVPTTLLDYPHASWWEELGQRPPPDSITGNLMMLGYRSSSLETSTARWAEENLTLRKIRSNEWLFMCYHAHDYFVNVGDFPDVDQYRRATLETIIRLAEAAPPHQYFVLFQFAQTPEAAEMKGIPRSLVNRNLDFLESAQREDGGWDDEHGLVQWQSFVTILTLLALWRFGRLQF